MHKLRLRHENERELSVVKSLFIVLRWKLADHKISRQWNSCFSVALLFIKQKKIIKKSCQVFSGNKFQAWNACFTVIPNQTFYASKFCSTDKFKIHCLSRFKYPWITASSFANCFFECERNFVFIIRLLRRQKVSWVHNMLHESEFHGRVIGRIFSVQYAILEGFKPVNNGMYKLFLSSDNAMWWFSLQSWDVKIQKYLHSFVFYGNKT